MKPVVSCVLSIFLMACAANAIAQQSIEIKPLKPNRTAWPQPEIVSNYGNLQYLGGLGFDFKPPEGCFGLCGGYSGMTIHPDGKKLTLVSDNNHWLEVDLALNNEGLPIGFAGKATVTKMSGVPANHHAESLRRVEKGWLLSFEVDDRRPAESDKILVLADEKKRFNPVSGLEAVAKSLAADNGLEAVALLKDGGMLLFEEGRKQNAGHSCVWYQAANGAVVGMAWPVDDEFRPTDAVATKNDAVLVLERRFPYNHKGQTIYFTSARLRLITPDAIQASLKHASMQSENCSPGNGVPVLEPQPGKLLLMKGEVVKGKDDPRSPLDNMEGIDVRCVRAPDNRDKVLWIYMNSDDNLNADQQTTMLLVFQSNNAELNKAACG
ncbi:MAG: esterase-like activity of phytase family protein [Ferrovibrio sp.]|uniref:esterase-like activity of phytase family protein n=1 Tax=Ferrovibrio sp. TaxID=1917215 RepID=UPI00391A7379